MESIACSECRAPINPGHYNTEDFFPCPSCRTLLKVHVFPAFFRPIASGKAGEALIDDEASCFFHTDKKAETACEHCGRFLCALCDMKLGGKHLCPTCLTSRKEQSGAVDLERHRTLHDSIALGLATLPLIVVWPSLFTAPIAFYFSIRNWNAPTSIIPRGKVRLVAAMILSGLQILGWALLIAYLVSYRHWK